MDWLIWLLLPGNTGRVYRRARLDGTRDLDSLNNGDAFYYFVRFVTALLAIPVALLLANGFGLAAHPVAVGATGFVVALLAWTLLPGVSGVRKWAASADDRWERRSPLLRRRARPARGRDCR